MWKARCGAGCREAGVPSERPWKPRPRPHHFGLVLGLRGAAQGWEDTEKLQRAPTQSLSLHTLPPSPRPPHPPPQPPVPC